MENADLGVLELVIAAFTEVLYANWGPVVGDLLTMVRLLTTILALAALPLIMAHVVGGIPTFALTFVKMSLLLWAITHLQRVTDILADLVVGTMLYLGGNQMTVAEFFKPGNILALFWGTLQPIFRYLSNLTSCYTCFFVNADAILFYSIFALIPMFFSFLFIAIHMVFAIIAFQLIVTASLLFLPLLIVPATASFGRAVISGIVGVSIRLGVLALVVSIQVPILHFVALPTLNEDFPLWRVFSAMAVAVIFAIMSWAAPRYASELFGGAPALTGATAMGLAAMTSLGALRGATMGGAGVGGGAAAGQAVASAAGGGSSVGRSVSGALSGGGQGALGGRTQEVVGPYYGPASLGPGSAPRALGW